MKLTNKEIFEKAEALYKAFEDGDKYFPAKINFCISKNKQTLFKKYDEISSIRSDVIKKYGKLDKETGNYNFDNDKIDIVNKELKDLLDIEQNIDISFIDFEDIEKLEFTSQQMDAILFMIEENDND